MARRLVDSVAGIGSIQAGDLTLRATRYQLKFWVDDDLPSESGDGNAETVVDGHIDITGIGEAAVLSGPDSLTLTLADGREIAIRIRSSGGDIIGRCL